MDERLRFVARLLEGEKIAPLFREFSTSRVAGYSLDRCDRECRLDGLHDRSKAPPTSRPTSSVSRWAARQSRWDQARGTPPGARPRSARSCARLELGVQTPAVGTVQAPSSIDTASSPAAVADATRPRAHASPGPAGGTELWCADFKGPFMLADHRYYYPLTITDFASRYLLACEGLTSAREHTPLAVFEHVFKEFGLPDRIRTDNGIPLLPAPAPSSA